MSNPNSTVARARARVWACVAEVSEGTRQAAQATADAMKQRYPAARVTVRSYKLGPRTQPQTRFMVRAYEVAA